MKKHYSNQCQSCGMNMTPEKNVNGTEAGGAKSEEFCIHCYENGSFTNDFTMEQMIEHATKRAIEAGAPKLFAPMLIKKGIPKLKRWSS